MSALFMVVTVYEGAGVEADGGAEAGADVQAANAGRMTASIPANITM